MPKEYYIRFPDVEGKWLIHDVQSPDEANTKAAKIMEEIAFVLEVDIPEYEVIEMEEH